MALTRIQLINHVLGQAQLDSSYQTLGRSWLNIVRKKFADDTNYKIWRTSTSSQPLITGQRSYDLPADFARADSCFIYNTDGSKQWQVFIYDSYEFDNIRTIANGDPTIGTIDEKNRKLIFNTLPDSSKTYILNYFYNPTDYSTDSTDDNVVPDFPNQNLLIQEMIVLAYEFRDDERYAQKVGEADRANIKNQRNLPQNVGTSQLQLNQSYFRPRFRRV